MRRSTAAAAALLAFTLAFAQTPPQKDGAENLKPEFTISPQVIEMGAFYGGAKLHVEGTAPADSQIAVAIRGESVQESLNRKARAGIIWVNSGKVHVSGVPSLLLVFSAEPVAGILSRQATDDYQLDASAVMKNLKMAPPEMDQQRLREDFFKLKERQGIYRFLPGTVRTDQAQGRPARFTLDVDWSKKAPPGRYEVTAYAIKNGSVVSQAIVPLEVRETGFPEWMASLALNRPMLYGLLAVLCALAAGFGIDFAASKLGKPAIGH